MAEQSKYTPELAEELCDRLSRGETLEDICRDPKMPTSRTVNNWKNDPARPEFASAIARAREDGEMVIANNLRRTARGEKGYSSGDVARDKLIIDSDFKLLAKWNPKKWGEKASLEHTGPDGGALEVKQTVDLSDNTVDVLKAVASLKIK